MAGVSVRRPTKIYKIYDGDYFLSLVHIWAKSASPSTKMLQLVKIEILDPSVGVRNY